MYSPVTRLLTILNLLQARPHVSAAELAGRLEVNPRSVRRYIIMLQDLGIPVEAERGRYGGYRLRPGYKLPPLMWTEEEALAIMLGLTAARQLGLAATVPTIESALAKVERVLPIALREQVQTIERTITLSLPSPQSLPSPYLSLLSAAYHTQCLYLTYCNKAQEQTERLFDCYGLLYKNGRWYTIGYCHLRAEMRIFRLDRIANVRLASEYFTKPADFDSLAYASRSFAAIPSRWQVEALLETSLTQLQPLVSSEFATLEETSDGVLLHADHDDLESMAHYLIGLGHRFRVIRPPELKQAIRKMAEELLHISNLDN